MSQNSARYRVTVPEADVSVNRWFEMQDNPGLSVRYIIREYIKAHGMTDPLCEDITEFRKKVSEDKSYTEKPETLAKEDLHTIPPESEPEVFHDEGDEGFADPDEIMRLLGN